MLSSSRGITTHTVPIPAVTMVISPVLIPIPAVLYIPVHPTFCEQHKCVL